MALPTGLQLKVGSAAAIPIPSIADGAGSALNRYYYLDAQNVLRLTETATTTAFDTGLGTLVATVAGNSTGGGTDAAFTWNDTGAGAMTPAQAALVTAILGTGAVPPTTDVTFQAGTATFTVKTVGTCTGLSYSSGLVAATAWPTAITVTSGTLTVADADANTALGGVTLQNTSCAFQAGGTAAGASTSATVTLAADSSHATPVQVAVAMAATERAKIDGNGNVTNLDGSTANTHVAYTNLVANDTVYVNNSSHSFTTAEAGTLQLNVTASKEVTISSNSGAGVLMSGGVSYVTANGNTAAGVNTAVLTGTAATLRAGTGGVANVTGLDAGESLLVTISAGNTYEYTATRATDDGIYVTQVQTIGGVAQTPTYYFVASGDINNVVYDNNGIQDDTHASVVSARAIDVLSTNETTSFNTMGLAYTPAAGETAPAVVNVNGATKTVTVNQRIESGVILRGAAAQVTDASNSETVYNLDGTNTVTANGSFTTNASGVLTAASGTLAVQNGTVSIGASNPSNLTVDLRRASATSVEFTGGLSSAVTVTGVHTTATATTAEYTMTITESTNTNRTTISREGLIEGLDGGAVITLPSAILGSTSTGATRTTFTTASAGTFTFNGQTYTVTDDDNVSFTVAAETNGAKVSTISGLAKDATVATADNISGTITVNGTTFTDITAKGGAKFTGVTTGAAAGTGTASVTLYSKNDTVTKTGAYIYTVTSMGSSDDGITIDFTTTDTISGLNNGDTVTVAAVGAPNTILATYTVNNNLLNVTTAAGTTSYTLNDGETSFTVTGADSTVTATITGGTAGETVANPYTFGTGGNAGNVTSLVNGMYINSNDEVSTSSDKAIAQVTISDDTATYTALSSKAQVVNVAGDTQNRDNWVITTLGGKDTITYAATTTTDATIDSGAGDDVVDVNGTGDKSIVLGDGKDSITAAGSGDMTLNAGSGNDTIRATGTGDMVINLDSGNNLITRGAADTRGSATIVGGTGKDSITARNSDDVVSGGDEADTFNVAEHSMTISDYVYDTDVLEVLTTTAAPNIAATNFGGDGVITISGSGASAVTADVSAGTGTGEFYAVNVVNGAGKEKQNVAWAKDGGSTIDVQSYEKAVTMIGDDDGKNALYAGKKNDTIYSYSDNDSVYGGEGKDSISMVANGSGRVVGVGTASGKDSVAGFTASFEDGDSIYMVDGSAADVDASFASNTVTFKDGNGSLQLNNITAKSTGAVELNVQGTKVALTGTNGVIATDSTSYANFYMGDNAAVNFATAEGEVNVDLRNGLDSGAEGAKFSGIIAAVGGAGNNTLIGAAAGETLTAGTGVSSLWGGAGKDTLVGNGASDAFFIGTGDGSDVVLNFSAAGNENADTLYTLSDITSAKLTNNGVEVSVSDTDKLTLRNVKADTAIKFNANGNAGVAKVGSTTANNNFTYDSTVTYYGGGNKSDKIAFASGSTENAQIWLDGSQGKAYASIDVVDGTNTSGNLLVAGDSSSQSIIGGKGDTSLWGGAGSATDTLKSSSTGNTMFWWGTGEGNDVVVSASANDSVNLYNLRLSDVDAANSSITNSGVSLALNDGSKLTVQTSRDMTFSIDGQSWTAQHNSKTWKQNS